MYTLAKLDEEKLKILQDYENRSGNRVLALQEVPVTPSLLPADQVAGLRALEDELGLCLLAVEQ